MKLEGLVLESKYPELNHLVKGHQFTSWRDGYPVPEQKILEIKFDGYLCELDEMMDQQEWNEEDREIVSKSLESLLSRPTFRDFWVHEKPKPRLPWPAYEDTHHNQIATVAAATGLVNEAIAYESRREGGPRESVMKKLQELQGDNGSSVEEDDLAAV